MYVIVADIYNIYPYIKVDFHLIKIGLHQI